ncbi:unnamed protein product [Prunus brigantina]
MVLVLPSEFSAPGGQVGGLDDDVAEEQLGQRPKTKEELLAMAFNEVIPRDDPNRYRHLKPLYVSAHVEGVPISKVFVDCGATLRHYMLPSVVQIISKTDLIKYMLTRPIIRGRIGKWTMALSEFTFQYVAQRSVKGQALADFLAHHPTQSQEEATEVEIGMAHMEKNYWTMYFDGCTNNQAEYEALIIGLEILQGMKATRVLVYGDSQLLPSQRPRPRNKSREAYPASSC